MSVIERLRRESNDAALRGEKVAAFVLSPTAYAELEQELLDRGVDTRNIPGYAEGPPKIMGVRVVLHSDDVTVVTL